MKIETQKFRIGELAEKLNLERYVLRFWEKKFDIQAQRSTGGQRFYNAEDMKKFLLIKELLYDKGFTISGAKQFLKKNKKIKSLDKQMIVASQVTTMEAEPVEMGSLPSAAQPALSQELYAQIRELQQKLMRLSELL